MALWLPEKYDTRSMENPAVPLTAMVGGAVTSGVYVNQTNALTLTAVQCAVTVIASKVAQYPFHVYRINPDGSNSIDVQHPAYPIVNKRPNRYMNRYKFMLALMNHALLWGNAYAQIIRDGIGNVIELNLLDPAKTTLSWIDNKTLVYHVLGTTLPAEDVFHLSGPISYDGLCGNDPILMARESLGLSLALQTYGAAYFGNGASPGSYYKTPNKLSPEQSRELYETLQQMHGGPSKAGKVALLSGGIEWVQTANDPQKAQALETRAHQILEVCRIFNIPPHKLMDFSRSTFSNIEETNKDFITGTISPWIEAIKSELDCKVIGVSQQAVWFTDVKYSDAMFGNLEAQSAYYNSMLDRGIMTVNEVRAEKGLNSIGSQGDKHLVGVNMTTLDKVGISLPAVQSDVADVESDQEQDDEQPNDNGIDTAKDAPDSTAVDAVRGVVADALGRMIRREIAQLRKASGRPDAQEAIRGVLEAHQSVLAEALAPGLIALNAVAQRSINPVEFAARAIADSLRQIETCDSVDELIERWEGSRVSEVMTLLEGN